MPLDATRSGQQITLVAPSIRCGGCIGPIERVLGELPGVLAARVNVSSRRIGVTIDPAVTDVDGLVAALDGIGVSARAHGAGDTDQQDSQGRALLLRVGVAGFAAMNIMLLSISVWSGADAATRDLLHWVSALIALPTIVYAGRPFFSSALSALSARRLNMDVPISLAVILSAGHSVLETAHSAQHAYFDAGVMLLFFLLIGRYLEHRTRRSARSAAAELVAMAGQTARVVKGDTTRETVSLAALEPGMVLEILPGERVPADGCITRGASDLDRALITGESTPEPAAPGDPVHAGMLNLTGPLCIEVTATGDQTLLAEIARLIDNAERKRGRYDRIADRAARLYAPLVHILAAVAFVFWYVVAGDLRTALQIAIAVLIVTCPCALALAVPTVQTVTSTRLFRRGIFLKDGAELERLAEIDTVAFDKTGTLTEGVPVLCDAPTPDDPAWPVAAALAAGSRHPCAQAISAEARKMAISPARLDDIREQPGLGVEGNLDGHPVRLGRAGTAESAGPVSALSLPGRCVQFRFTEQLRQDAAESCAALRRSGLHLTVLSGDQPASVARIAKALEIDDAQGGLLPADKLDWLADQQAAGSRVLMVGDGLNDGPALAAAHASISPASAVDVAKTAAGLVFTGQSLSAVSAAHAAAKTARRRAFESFAIAAAYNAIAIPMAMAGLVTPLFAAAAMSLSSILVILNALRPGART